MELLYAFFAPVVIALAVDFWIQCAKPMLRFRGASRLTTRLPLGVTIYTVVAEAIFIAAIATGHVSQMLWWIAGLPWALIVGLPYLDGYRIYIRLFRRR